MKILKYILLAVVAIAVIGLIYVGTYTGKYNVTRSKVIKAPVATVYNVVSDLKTWEKWGPWHDEDSTIVVTYGNKTIGVGATSSWTSKDGPGKMETVGGESYKSIEQKISFMDNDPGDIFWRFEEVEGGTKVTWGMKAEASPFMFKMIAAMVGGWDAMFGPMEEKGLNNLSRLITNMPKLYRLSEVSTVELEPKKFIGYHQKMKINHEAMTKAFTEYISKAGNFAEKSGLKEGDYTPAAVYTKYDEASGETEFYIGLILHKEFKGTKEMSELNLTGGKAVKVSKFGNYGDGDYEAHLAIDAYLNKQKLEKSFPMWETFPNDPNTVKPEALQTDIYYPIKK